MINIFLFVAFRSFFFSSLLTTCLLLPTITTRTNLPQPFSNWAFLEVNPFLPAYICWSVPYAKPLLSFTSSS